MPTATETLLNPIVVRPGEDRATQPLTPSGNHVIVKASGADTGGKFVVGILRAQPMSGPPLHMHTREDEWFYVLDGELTFQLGDQRFTGGPGTAVFAPRGVPHTWQNLTGEVAEAIGMITPPEFENFFVEASRGTLDPDQLIALMHEYGVELLGPPLAH